MIALVIAGAIIAGLYGFVGLCMGLLVLIVVSGDGTMKPARLVLEAAIVAAIWPWRLYRACRE